MVSFPVKALHVDSAVSLLILSWRKLPHRVDSAADRPDDYQRAAPQLKSIELLTLHNSSAAVNCHGIHIYRVLFIRCKFRKKLVQVFPDR